MIKIENEFFPQIIVGPFVFTGGKEIAEHTIRHGEIHWRQQIELLIVGWYIWYVLEYIYKFWLFQDPFEAYNKLSFEIEARGYENNPYYLGYRTLWAWTNYI